MSWSVAVVVKYDGVSCNGLMRPTHGGFVLSWTRRGPFGPYWGPFEVFTEEGEMILCPNNGQWETAGEGLASLTMEVLTSAAEAMK